MALMELLVYQCGMRRPSLGQNGGDLSRLTSASSDTESSNNLQTVVVAHVGALQAKNNIERTTATGTSPTKLLSPTYLTDLLDTTEWLKSSRKRKERQDSTSSTTQERKLVRSNSEEFISQNYEDYDGLRRVSSHEDFKKRTTSTSSSSSNSSTGSTSSNDDDDREEDDEPQNDENRMPNSNHTAAESHPILNHVECSNKLIGELVKEKSPCFAQKYRLSPVRDIKYKNDDNTDGAEHERQRQNERFSKMRATPGRKAISPRKSSKHSNSMKMMRDKDENCYKYDISALKYERRGFVSSKHKLKEHIAQQQKQQNDEQKENEPKDEIPLNEDAIDVSDYNDNNLKEAQNKSPKYNVTKEEDLPWSKSFQNDTPIVCPRFADNPYDHVNNSQDKPAKFYTPIIIMPAKDTKSGSALSQSKISRDTMKKPASLYLTADEKIKQINKRLILLKKRYSQYEEKFELSHGHKPSPNDKVSDKIIKNLVSEMSKLRREKHHLKQEPRNYLYSSTNNNNNSMNSNNNYYKVEDDAISEELREEAKLSKMKETLVEIEKRLLKKRVDESRSVELETLTPDELIKEKTSVQKGLLYFESLFGRPVTRDERDAARPLYDRYRSIKRLVNRNAMLSGSGISVPELPTILEHEAMAFTCTTTTTSLSNDRTSLSTVSVGESDTSDSVQSTTDSTDTSSSMTENVHIMSIQELWTQMDATREETKTLKKTIKEFEEIFEERNGRKMLKTDRKLIEETYSLYKQKKAKLRLLDALIKKQMSTF